MIGFQTALLALLVVVPKTMAAVPSYCGPNATITQDGSATVTPLAKSWGAAYSKACGPKVITNEGSTTEGAIVACGGVNPITKKTGNIGMLSRKFKDSEATLIAGGNGYDYKCLIGAKKTARLLPVAVDGVSFSFKLGGDAAKCLPLLPGKGLTVDQLRWIFSNYTYAQLVANKWDKNALTNSNGKDTDRLWSELNAGCPKTQILIAGPPSSAGTNSFVAGLLFTGTGEGFRTPYFTTASDDPTKIVGYLKTASAAIGFFGYPYYNSNKKTLGAATIKNTKGAYVAPSSTTIASGSYGPFSRLIYMGLVLSSIKTTGPYVKWGHTSGGSLVTAAGAVPLSSTIKNQLAAKNVYV